MSQLSLRLARQEQRNEFIAKRVEAWKGLPDDKRGKFSIEAGGEGYQLTTVDQDQEPISSFAEPSSQYEDGPTSVSLEDNA